MRPGAVEREVLETLLRRGFRYALSLTHSAPSAEDLVQDAWLAILSKRRPLHAGYLFATIRNRFIDIRRRDRVLALEPHDDPGAILDEQEIVAGMDEEIRLRVVDLERALGDLAWEEREALFLMSVEGYTALEVARLTGRPRGTVLSLVHRGRRKLRRLLREDNEERSA